MARPEDAEVAIVQGGQLGFIQPLDNREHSSVHESYIGVSVTITNLADPPVILGVQFLHTVSAGLDVVEKGEEDPGVKPGLYQPVYFDQHGRWDDQGLHSVLQKIEAAPVLGVVPV